MMKAYTGLFNILEYQMADKKHYMSYNPTTKTVFVLDVDTLPAGAVSLGDFDHPAEEDILGYSGNHVLYHHVKEALYHRKPDGSEGFWPDNITDMSRLTITTTTEPVVQVTVTFDSDGGSVVAAQTFARGGLVVEPAAPTKAGFVFGGWLSGVTPYVFATPVTADVTLTAQWTPE